MQLLPLRVIEGRVAVVAFWTVYVGLIYDI